PALRLGFDLSDGEKEFLQKRMKVMPGAFQKFLNLKVTPQEKDVPVVAVLGSGGGLRATISLLGCLLALEEQGLLDCITYMNGVSGSTWCISNLYQQPLWGKGETSGIAQEIQELKACTIAPKYGAFSPETLLKFRNAMTDKKEDNQFVSLTDLWGLVLQWIFGKQEKLVRLSDQQKVVSTGQVPYPIYSAINVKSTVSTDDFAEWVEFTPHEVGMPKYGGFVRTADFGSEFYMGNLVRRHAELPLHYLQGLWGSAFAASLDRIYLDATGSSLKLLKSFKTKISALDGKSFDFYLTSHIFTLNPIICMNSPADKAQGHLATKVVTPVSWLSSALGNIFSKHRAGQNFNFLSGCFLSRNYPTSSQFLTKDVTSLGLVWCAVANFDSQPNQLTPLENNIFLVDAGLKLNSAFPLVMRPQRNVDVIISFDFSWQTPFTTLTLTSKYCQEHGIPFPKIDIPSCNLDDLHECYIFSDESDPRAPIVLHFPLINNSFRKFKTPGNPRVTQEECSFGDFDVYMSNSPYRTFNFTYSELEFDRLIALNHYNVVNNLPAIRQALQSALKRTKRRALPANSEI
uniref:Phospholipase A2, group IVF, tandem duplicate 2 n=1 Tax=Petromyzon marinus TaxID=7757 RepID=S4RJ95_PETMA